MKVKTDLQFFLQTFLSRTLKKTKPENGGRCTNFSSFFLLLFLINLNETKEGFFFIVVF
jgi:hypothetical protein